MFEHCSSYDHYRRRVFLHMIEDSSAAQHNSPALKENTGLGKWIKQQLLVYLGSLQNMIKKMSDSVQEPAIKTMIEVEDHIMNSNIISAE